MSWVAAVPVVGKIIDKIFPDADQASKAKTALTEWLSMVSWMNWLSRQA